MDEKERYKKRREKYGDLYFKDGRPKKKYMMCYSREYLAKLRHINGYSSPGKTCAGNRCIYYGKGCW